jgi:hypothetical protein
MSEQIENLDPSDPYVQRKLRRLAKLKKENGLAFYKPHPKQDLFHKAGDKKRRYVRTGNRFGKSELGATEDCAWALGERPWYAKDDPARYIGLPKRPTKGLIIVADWDKAEEIFTCTDQGAGIGKLIKYLPPSRVEYGRKNNAGVIGELRVKSIHGGWSKIHLDTVKSFKANPMGQESSSWDWIHVDEPCPQDMWKANSRGLMDTGGSAWFTCTPINQAWINDVFVPSRRVRIEKLDKPLEKDKNHWMITGSSYDNPHLSKEDVAMFEDELSEAERQCRIEGLPLALSGLIYKNFKYDEHVLTKVPHGWEGPKTPPKNYMIRVAIDPHPQTPHAVMFEATSPTGLKFYYAELFRKELISQLSEAIHEVTGMRFVQQYICDPSAFIEHPVDGSSMSDIFYQNSIPVERAPKDLERGIMATEAALARRTETPGGVKIPEMFFPEHMEETIWEFDHYEWDMRRENKPVDKNDHMMENLYRLVITHPGYIAPQGEKVSVIPFTKQFQPDLAPPHYGVVEVSKPSRERYPA